MLVKKGDKILLGETKKLPGLFVVPGGGVDFGETLSETGEREIFEETNISIKNIKFFKPYELINERGHRIMILHTAEYESGEIKAGDDLLSAGFYDKSEIAKLVQENKIDKGGPVYNMLVDTGYIG